MRKSLAAVAGVVASLSVGLALAGDLPPPNIHPAEAAFTLFAKPVVRRTVVRGDRQALDVWLVSKQPFAKTGERLQQAAAVQLTLPHGYKVVRATWLDADQTWWVDLVGGTHEVRARVSRHRDGSLLVLGGLGHKRDAKPWAPPYKPLPINLPHGPIRP